MANMPDRAPIAWLINEITGLVSGTAATVAANISNTVAPIAGICFGIYLILIAFNYMRGAESDPVGDVMVRAIGFTIVLGLGFTLGDYATTVLPIVQNLGNDLASAAMKGVGGASSSNEAQMDALAMHYVNILSAGATELSGHDFGEKLYYVPLFIAKFLLILGGLIPLLVAAIVVTIIANVGSTMVAMVGPLFFAFLLFPATRQYFSSWVNTAISYALIPLFVAVVAGMSLSLSTSMFGSSGGAISLEQTSLFTVFFASIGNLTLLFLLKQVSSLASSLSAGGINAGMVGGGMGSIAKGIAGSFKKQEQPGGGNGKDGGKSDGRDRSNILNDGLARAGVRGGAAAGRGAVALYNKMRGGNSIRKAG